MKKEPKEPERNGEKRNATTVEAGLVSRLSPRCPSYFLFSLLLSFLFLSFPPLPSFAAFEDLGAGARAPGMGNAFTALADDAYAIYYNPAGLAQLQGAEVSASYSELYTGLSDNSTLGLSNIYYAQPIEHGEQGTAGLAFDQFALNSLYTEQTFYLSYGRTLWSTEAGSKLMLGVNAKYLRHTFSTLPEAGSACQGFNCSFGSDSVLSGKNAAGAADADIGALYLFPKNWQAGLEIQHLAQPNVGFSGTDTVPMNIHAGVAYKALWMNILGELQLDHQADGTFGHDGILAAERYFPTLEYGDFGLRLSLGIGSEGWEQLTAGLSYRVNKLQFDYGFLMPFGGIAGTSGTHRFSVSFRFGAPNPEQQITQQLLEKAKALQKGQAGLVKGQAPPVPQIPQFTYQKPHDIDDPQMAQVKDMIDQGRLREAYVVLTGMMVTEKWAPDKSVTALAKRLELASSYYPTLPEKSERWQSQLWSAALLFFGGDDRRALLHGSYAMSLNPNDLILDHFLTEVSKATHIALDKLPADSQKSYLSELFSRAEAAGASADYEQAVRILQDVLDLEPNNVTAFERLGSINYLAGHVKDAIDAWNKALSLETKPDEIRALKQYLEEAKARLKSGGAAAPAATPQAQPAEAPAKGKAADTRQIPALYQQAVTQYAQGHYIEATALFLRILQIDPGNAEALKALERIQQLNTSGQSGQ